MITVKIHFALKNALTFLYLIEANWLSVTIFKLSLLKARIFH